MSVDDPTGAAGDNARFLVLDTAARPTVLVITTSGDLARDAFYLEQALVAAGSDGRAYCSRGRSVPGNIVSWDQARLDAHTAIVLTSTRALEHHGRELLTAYLKKGGGMIVAAGPDVDGEVLQELLAGPRISLVNPGAAVPAPNSENLGSVGRSSPRGASLRFDERRPGARAVPAGVSASHATTVPSSRGSRAANRPLSTARPAMVTSS